ncbi:MAG: T9SS type A sorting domain-containing protein [Bacteroidetes bacterium]|nr:T9SS type A sorting domain-containing protein [Bacteroidota bacterium]
MKVFDVLGREAATLVNEELNSGEHSVIFDAKGLATGLYFYRLSAGSFVETKKMILLQ